MRRKLWSVVAALVCVIAFAGTAHARPPLSNRGDWEARTSSPLARTEVATARLGRFIYVLGGYATGGAPSRAVERYDTRRDRWSLVSPMPVALNHAGAVSYQGALYVVGGYRGAPFSLGIGTGGSADASRAFFRYDPDRDSWSRLPPAPTARGAMATAVMGHRLYVGAGADSGRALRRFEIFDFARRRWTIGPSLPRASDHTAGVAVAGAFYVIGGRPFYGGGTNRFVQRYDPRRDKWERVADLKFGRAGFLAIVVCGQIVVLGGEDPSRPPDGTVPEVESYDPDSDRWRRLPDMRTPRHGLAGARVRRTLYTLEGGPVTLLAISNVAEALDVRCGSRRASG